MANIIIGGTFKEYDRRKKGELSWEQYEKQIQEELKKGPEQKMTPLPEPVGWKDKDTLLIKCDGWWWLSSNSDPRWKADGRGEVGGYDMCPEAKKALEALKTKYGSKVPWDFIYRIEPRNLKKFKLSTDPDQLNKR